MIKEYKDFIDKDESWSGIHDSFQSVIELKEGKNALITEELYEQFKDVSSEIKTRVSFVGSEKDWCFIALKGDKNKSPRWYFIDENENIHTDFPDVCNSLRNSINKDLIKLKWDDISLHKFINLFKQKERELLPPKKKRALQVAEYILERKIKAKESNTNQSLKQSMRVMLKLLKPNSKDAVDFERLAEEWIEIFQPYIDEKRELNKRKKTVLNLLSLKSDYRKINIDVDLLNEMIDNSTIVDEIDNKIASCIIGVSNKTIVQSQPNL